MKVEDLKRGKKYRHSLFNFDLIFSSSDEDNVYFYRETYNRNKLILLEPKELQDLTEVREPIKKESVSFCLVDPDKNPISLGFDLIFGLPIISFVKKEISDIVNFRKRLMQNKERMNSVIVKITTTSVEMTEEEIKKEL
jgi:hypothetical protein